MTNNTVNTTANSVPTLTAKEIFDQIVIVQHTLVSLSHLTEAAQTIYGEDSESDSSAEAKARSVELLVDAFKTREETYHTLIAMYEKMYDDVVYPDTSESVKKAIAHIMDYDEGTMDANAKLGAIDALLQSQE